MRKWNSFMEILKFPLMILVIAIFLRGISGTILSPNVAKIVVFQQDFIYIIAELISYFSGVIISNFPLIVLLKYLSRNHESATPVVIGFLAYLLFNIVTMFLSDPSLPVTAYASILGLQVNAKSLHIAGETVRYPLQTGVVGALVVGVVSRFHYKRSRTRTVYGFLSFIDRDAWAYIATLISTILGAVAVSLLWPHLINGLYVIFNFIAYDIANPVNSFIYGIMDRLLSLVNLSSLIRTPFWFGEMGGSWINSAGTTFFGDIAIWTAQAEAGIFGLGAGRFITPYYIINMFALPATLITIYRTYTDKLERRRYLLFIVVMILFSILSGTILPIELYLLFLAPMYFVFHLVITGILFAICQAIPIFIGYSYSGSVITANPGGIFDLTIYLRNLTIQNYVIILVIIGVVVFALYSLFGWFYYNRAALDILGTGSKVKKVNLFLESIGGIKNVRTVNAGADKIIVQVYDSLMLDFSKIQTSGAYKIVESRAGYSIYYGPSSTIIKNEVAKRLKEREKLKLPRK